VYVLSIGKYMEMELEWYECFASSLFVFLAEATYVILALLLNALRCKSDLVPQLQWFSAGKVVNICQLELDS
jgi:hypothetical protein